MLKKAMIYLGLGPDEHYEAYDDANQSHANSARVPRYTNAVNSGGYANAPGQLAERRGMPVAAERPSGNTVRPLPIKTEYDQHDMEADVRPVMPQSLNIAPRHANSRQVTAKPYTVAPEDFRQAKEIGDRFKSGQAVIINLQAASRDLRRRIVDFSSGLCYGRDGKMDRVADQVYLLTPVEFESFIPKSR